MDASAAKKRILILGGGFGAVATARHLEGLCRRRLDVEIVLVFPAWLIRRTYYLLQMPGWGRRLRIVIDWTFSLLFRPDVVKVGLDSETAALLREVALGDAAAGPRGEGGARTDSATDGSPLALVRPEVR